jgi:hypothetical protein
MEQKDRFCIQKLLNVAYQLAVLENAAQTEGYIAKLISFFRYYLSGKEQTILLREELYQLRILVELFGQSSPSAITIEIQAALFEVDLYIGSNSILNKIQELLFDASRRFYSNYKIAVVMLPSDVTGGGIPVQERIRVSTSVGREDILNITVGVIKAD